MRALSAERQNFTSLKINACGENATQLARLSGDTATELAVRQHHLLTTLSNSNHTRRDGRW